MSTPSLGESGSQLWEAAEVAYRVSASHKPLLLNACRTVDRLDALNDALEGAPLTVTNSKGDEVANPLLTEARQQLLALRQVLHSLGIRELDVQKTTKKTMKEALAEIKAQAQ